MDEGQDSPRKPRKAPEPTSEEVAAVLLHLRALLEKGKQPKARDIWDAVRKMNGERVNLVLGTLLAEGRIGCIDDRFFIVDGSE